MCDDKTVHDENQSEPITRREFNTLATGAAVSFALPPLANARRPYMAASRGQGAVRIKVGYKMVDLGQIDLDRGIYFCVFKLFAGWQDENLKGCSKAVARSALVYVY